MGWRRSRGVFRVSSFCPFGPFALRSWSLSSGLVRSLEYFLAWSGIIDASSGIDRGTCWHGTKAQLHTRKGVDGWWGWPTGRRRGREHPLWFLFLIIVFPETRLSKRLQSLVPNSYPSGPKASPVHRESPLLPTAILADVTTACLREPENCHAKLHRWPGCLLASPAQPCQQSGIQTVFENRHGEDNECRTKWAK